MKTHRRRRSASVIFLVFVLLMCGITIVGFLGVQIVTREVASKYGEPGESLSLLSKTQYVIKLYLDGATLLTPINLTESETYFDITPGETVGQISFRLQDANLIWDADLFRTYLVYRGFDRSIQSGFFKVTSGMNAIALAEKLIDSTPKQVQFMVLAGWRAEEIAGSLPRSGLQINPQDFIDFVQNPPVAWLNGPNFRDDSLEGYLGTGLYIVDRDISLEDFIGILTERFQENVSPAWLETIQQEGLDLRSVIILASIVEREAVVTEEMPLIASVFINRYWSGMKLDSDPTVQYAIGFNARQSSWWTNPLSGADLQFDSAYNTYLYGGLPPAPICNPSLEAIQAVVFYQESPYYYFRARCDGSGLHNFSETYEQHLEKGCP